MPDYFSYGKFSTDKIVLVSLYGGSTDDMIIIAALFLNDKPNKWIYLFEKYKEFIVIIS